MPQLCRIFQVSARSKLNVPAAGQITREQQKKRNAHHGKRPYQCHNVHFFARQRIVVKPRTD